MAAVEEGTLSNRSSTVIPLSPDSDDHGNGSKDEIEMSLLSPNDFTTSTTRGHGNRSDPDNVSRMTATLNSRYSHSMRSGMNLPHYSFQYVDKVIAAVKTGDVEKLNKLSKKLGTEGLALILKEHDGKNNSALHYAALGDNTEMLKMLINNGADVNDAGEGGKRPLHFAVITKSKKRNIDAEHDGKTRESIVSVLLEENADVNATDLNGMTPLHYAASQGNMEAFITLLSAPGVTIDTQDRRKTTALCQACQSGNTDGALMLINKGADPLISDVNGDTPLHIAIRHSHTMIVTTLLEVADGKQLINRMLMATNSSGLIPLYEAVKFGNTELFHKCLEHEQVDDDPRRSVSEEDEVVHESEMHIEELVNVTGENGDTLLHVAAAAGHVEIAETLVSRGARLDAVNNDAQTPLHLACTANHQDISRCLVEHHADANAVDNAGHNPLQLAAIHDSFGTMMTVLQCIAMGAGGRCNESSDLLEWAAINNMPKTVRKILDYEFRLHDFTDDGIMDFIMHAVKKKHKAMVDEMIRWKRAVVDHRDKEGFTPLHHAAQGGADDIALALIKAKARVNSKNGMEECERTPLHYAASKGWTRTARVLLDNGASIDAIDMRGMTPLHHACMHGQLSMVELLLHGKGAAPCTTLADIATRDVDELNCLDHAIDNGYEEVAKCIISHHSWRDVMSSSSVEEDTLFRTTPLRKLIKNMPCVAERVLDRCITVKGGKKDKDMSVEFYYEFLEDSFSSWMKHDIPDDVKNNNANGGIADRVGGRFGGFFSRVYKRVSLHTMHDVVDDQFDEKGRLTKKSKAYIHSSKERSENHPVNIMAVSARVELLEHPLVGAFLQNKWNSVGRYVFAASLLIYCIFLAMLTGYISVIPPNFYVKSVNQTPDEYGVKRVEWYADGQERWVDSVSRSTLMFFDYMGPTLIVTLSALNLLRELGQIFLQRFSYFLSADNYLEWFLYITSILFALPFSEAEYVRDGKLKRQWQWRFGAMAGFFGWINLLLFIRRNSRLGIYVIMFIDICRTFLKFALILFLFIVAFAIAFYALLMNQDPFHTLGDCLSKTFVMMIGELDYANIFFGEDYLGTSNTIAADGEDVWFLNTLFDRPTTFLFFSVFLVVMGILMMNMLVGLAVDDIQAIQEKANLHRLTMQVETVMEVQAKFPLWVWRSSVIKKKRFKVNEVKVRKWMQKLSSVRKLIKKAIINQSDHMELHSAQSPADEAVDKIRQRLKDIGSKVERATHEMADGARKQEEHIEQIGAAQRGLREKSEALYATQERLTDRVDLMDRKLDAILKRLKVKEQ